MDVDLHPIGGDDPLPSVLVLPGGGFREHTEHDGQGYARWFNSLGIARGAVEALLGDKMSQAAELSPARWGTGETPPTLVWVTAQDGPGLPNALKWARVLADHEVPVELHIYPEGPHGVGDGVGLADGVPYGAHGHRRVPHTAQWAAACERWLAWLGVIQPR